MDDVGTSKLVPFRLHGARARRARDSRRDAGATRSELRSVVEKPLAAVEVSACAGSSDAFGIRHLLTMTVFMQMTVLVKRNAG